MLTAGRSLYACQQLEYGLKVVMYMVGAAGLASIPAVQASAVVEGRAPKTLGQVFAAIRKHVTLSDGWTELIETGVAARNTIIHGFLVHNAERLIEPESRSVVIGELKVLRAQVLAADSAVRQILETLYSVLGIRLDDLFLEAELEIRVRNRRTETGRMPS
jgi:hypothetical protein